jgi:hypothetical protein
MEKKAEELAAEETQILTEAQQKEDEIKKAEEEYEAAKEEAAKKMEELGISTKKVRTAATGTAAERRAKNNFQYRLKSNGWMMNYNLKNRITDAQKYGLTVTFEPEEYVVTGGKLKEPFKHPYGQNSLSALSQVVKDNATEDLDDLK